VDLRRQSAIVRVWFPVIVASVLLAAVAAYLVSIQLPKVYEAKATLVVGQSLSTVNPDYNQLLVSQQLSTTYARVATTRPILENVTTQLGLAGTLDDLAARVRADAQLDSTLLKITVQDADPSRAAAIANAVADQLIAASPAIQGRQTDLQKSIDADLQATQDQITANQAQVEALVKLPNRTAAQDTELQTLQSQLITLRSTYATLFSLSSGNASNLLSVIEPAVAPTSPVSPKVALNVLVAILLGLIEAAVIAFVADYLDDRVQDADAVQKVAGLSTLGTISRMKTERSRGEPFRLAALLDPRSDVAEAYRTLRTNVEFAPVDRPTRTLLVTSSIGGEGRTVTAANLAVVFAQAGRRVLLVDADLRKAGVHIIFGLPNEQGLTTLFRESVSPDAVAQKTELAKLRILTAGQLPPNPAELLGSARMREIVEGLKSGYDLVIFDSPSLQAVTDSAILSSFLDATLLVVDAGHTRRRSVLEGREALAKVNANVLGVVLNDLPPRSLSDYAGFYRSYSTKRA
jgi:succinoglycan biosynthesis transport protein ExoP